MSAFCFAMSELGLRGLLLAMWLGQDRLVAVWLAALDITTVCGCTGCTGVPWVSMSGINLAATFRSKTKHVCMKCTRISGSACPASVVLPRCAANQSVCAQNAPGSLGVSMSGINLADTSAAIQNVCARNAPGSWESACPASIVLPLSAANQSMCAQSAPAFVGVSMSGINFAATFRSKTKCVCTECTRVWESACPASIVLPLAAARNEAIVGYCNTSQTLVSRLQVLRNIVNVCLIMFQGL